MKVSRRVSLALLVLAALVQVEGATAQQFVPAIVFDMGGKFDKSFNEAAYRGAERRKPASDTASSR